MAIDRWAERDRPYRKVQYRLMRRTRDAEGWRGWLPEGVYGTRQEATARSRELMRRWVNAENRRSAMQFHITKETQNPNPSRIKLPSKFTMMPVRVNKKGEVQIGVNPSKVKNGRVAKNVKRVEATHTPRTKRNPRNGYVVYPDSIGKFKLADANREAKRESIDYGKARVESVDTGKTVARWENGRKV